MDDFLSLYLAVNICKAFDYGFGLEDKAPWQAQERNISRKPHYYDFFTCFLIFTIISMTIMNKIGGTQVMFSSKVDEKDLRGSGSFLSSSVYDSQEIQKICRLR
jgi:hypothetical protein